MSSVLPNISLCGLWKYFDGTYFSQEIDFFHHWYNVKKKEQYKICKIIKINVKIWAKSQLMFPNQANIISFIKNQKLANHSFNKKGEKASYMC